MIKAGFSRVDVTPPLGSYLSGYFSARYAKGMIDPIYLNAIALSDGNDTAVIIIADGFFAPPEIRGAEIAIPSGML